MPRFVVDPRARTLLGQHRRRRLLGDIVAPDLGTPTFAPPSTIFAPSEPAPPSFPPDFFTPSVPVMPAKVAQPAPVAPDLGLPSFLTRALPGVQIVFPSQGSIATSRPVAASSWLDQQLIAGVPNSYLLGGVGAVIVFAMLASRKRRR